MSEHLRECPCRHHPRGYYWCICHRLQACEARALDEAVQRVEAIADDPNSGVDWNWDYDIDPSGMTRNPLVWIREAVAAIKNEVK